MKPRAWPGKAAAAALGLLALLGACRRAAPAPLAPQGRRILVLGIDAGDWQAIDALVEQGRLPTFARLAARGKSAVLVTTPPLVSPLVWTTIATGRQPEDHGVLDFMRDLPGGGQAPISSNERRVAALWNVFSSHERDVAVVGWWATAPAEPVRGTLVSDRLAPQLLRPATGLGTDAVWPAGALERLAPDVVRPESLTRAELVRYAPLDEAEFARAQTALAAPGKDALYRDRMAHLAAVVAGTRTYATIVTRLLRAGEQPAFAAVYLEAVDTLSHLFVRESWGEQTIAAAYADADALLERLAGAVAPDTLVVVCSDHGFHAREAGILVDPADLAGPATAWHRPYGIVAVSEARALLGPARATPPAHVERTRVTPLDLAPTVLHAAGLPVSSEMPGRVALELLPDDVRARPVRKAPSGPRPTPQTASTGADPDVVARLQALGYLGAAPTSLARQNLGESLYRRGRLEAAERELRAVTEAQPGNLAARLWLARALAERHEGPAALAVYEQALRLPGGRDDALVAAVELALALGKPDAAERLIAAAGGPSSVPAGVARALVARAAGRTGEAERGLRAALGRDPAAFEALAPLFELLLAQGRAREFAPVIARAVERAPRAPRLLALQGETWLATGDAARAESALAQGLALAPDSAALRLDLARAQLRLARPDAALETLAELDAEPGADALRGAAYNARADWPRAAERFRAALERAPQDTSLLNGLAWAELQRGRRDEARALLERSLGLDPHQPEIRKLHASLAPQAGG